MQLEFWFIVSVDLSLCFFCFICYSLNTWWSLFRFSCINEPVCGLSFSLGLFCVSVCMACVGVSGCLSCRDWSFFPLSSYLEVDPGWTLCTWASFVCWRASALFLVWGCMSKVTLKFLQGFFFSSGCSFLQSTWECLAFEEASGFPSTALLAFVIRSSVNELCTRATTLDLHLFFPQAPLFLFVCLFSRTGNWTRGFQMPGMYPTSELHS